MPPFTNLRTALSALVTLSFGGASTEAFAHAELKSEIPAANASVSPAPTNITLKFSEGIELKLSGVTMTGPGGYSSVALGDAALAPNDDTTLIVPIKGTLAAGKYDVSWHNLSKDGHSLKGHYAFTVK